METHTISYMRQKDLFDPIKQRFKIIVLGTGAIGSFVTLNLAKLGFNDILVYDYDKVESYNIPNQFFKISDIGKFKVDALKETVKEFADVDIETEKKKVTKNTEFPVGLNNLFILAFDTLRERKKIFNKLKEIRNCYVMDIRVGGEEYNIQTINLFKDEEIKEWEKSFNIIPVELSCSAKSICYTNLSVTSEVCNIVKKLNNNEKYPTRLIRHMRSYRIINNQK